MVSTNSGALIQLVAMLFYAMIQWRFFFEIYEPPFLSRNFMISAALAESSSVHVTLEPIASVKP